MEPDIQTWEDDGGAVIVAEAPAWEPPVLSSDQIFAPGRLITPQEFRRYAEDYFQWASKSPRTLTAHLSSLEDWAHGERHVVKYGMSRRMV